MTTTCNDRPPVTGASWVERWLDRYCEPGAHTFRLEQDRILVCEHCGKTEAVIRTCCAVCEIPAETRGWLVSGRDGALSIHGELCGVCCDEFRERGEIRGWRVESEPPAQEAH
jgi:hypothetical protein